jgi:hypothetical protein
MLNKCPNCNKSATTWSERFFSRNFKCECEECGAKLKEPIWVSILNLLIFIICLIIFHLVATPQLNKYLSDAIILILTSIYLVYSILNPYIMPLVKNDH